MKKNLTLLFLLFTLISFGQEDYNKWSVGLNFGSHDAMHPTPKFTKAFQLHHFGANGRYMMNSKVGIMLDVGYDYIDTYDNPVNTNYWRTSVQGVVNVGNLLCFDTWTKRVGLLVHGGAGFSHLWLNKDLRTVENPSDPLFKGVDDMLNYTFGSTVQFMVTDNISLNADLSFVFHNSQTYRWDYSAKNHLNTPIDGTMINTSIGASYYFGKNKKHADWSPSNCMSSPETSPVDNSKYDAYEARINKLEEMLANKEVIIDKDNDGIADEFDLCPDLKGLYSDNGCPDTDGDGVDDLKDKCPDVAGLHSNNGCPEIEEEVKLVMAKALKGVQFETGKTILLARSNKALDAVAEVMEDHPEYYLNINGHTDNIGGTDANMVLSIGRMQAVVDYLAAKGVAVERMHGKGFGETAPKASNENKAGQATNRRVEFEVVFE